MPQELRQKILHDYLQVTRNTVGQAVKLQWVVVLGKGWMGLEAFKMLMESVTVWDISGANSFMNAGKPTSFLARHFSIDKDGNVTTAFSYVKSFYLAFDLSLVDLAAPPPFCDAFGPSLGLFNNLHSFAFDICEYDYNKSFVYITSVGVYPESLKTVRLFSSSTKVRAELATVPDVASRCQLERSKMSCLALLSWSPYGESGAC